MTTWWRRERRSWPDYIEAEYRSFASRLALAARVLFANDCALRSLFTLFGLPFRIDGRPT